MKQWKLAALIVLGGVLFFLPIIFLVLSLSSTENTGMISAGVPNDSKLKFEGLSLTDTAGVDLSQLSRNRKIKATILVDINWSQEEKEELAEAARAAYPDKNIFDPDKTVDVMFFAPYWLEKENAYLVVMRVYMMMDAA